MEPIRGEALLQAEDFKAAWRALPDVRRFAIGAGFLLFMWSLGAAMYPAPAFLVVPFGALAFGYGLFQGRARWAATGMQGFGGGTVKYLFDDDGYHFEAPGRQQRLGWAAVPRYIETKEAFLIFSSPHVTTLVPKRAFAAGDHARLSAELQARIPPPKKRGSLAGKLVVVWVVVVVALLALWQLVMSPSTR
jgi:YcxB-like protein